MIVKIEKLIFGGQGLGRVDNKVVFVWGALPGEEVEIDVLKKKKNFIEGIVKRVIAPSPFRVQPIDDHFDSCSPWQIMSFAEENKWKKEIAIETYKKNGNISALGGEIVGNSETVRNSEEIAGNIEIATDSVEFGYRNKMEYNFTFNEKNEPSLAFHHRGTHRLRAITNCALAHPAINQAGESIIEWLKNEQLPFGTLKSLVLRVDTNGRVAAGLFLKQRVVFKNAAPTEGVLAGMQVYLSDYRSPASVPTELMHSFGNVVLESEINKVKLQFGLLSFFQINMPIFEVALRDIEVHLTGGRVVDYYCGVGSIALALHGKYKEALLIEENAEAAAFAQKNIELNNFKNVTVEHSLAEKSTTQITSTDTVIVDPPRIGMHKDMVAMLLKKEPQKIIYLSCGLDTQARDIALLSTKYKPTFFKLYNFFPRTPHIEGLCVLEKV